MTPQIQTLIYVVIALIAGYIFGMLDKWFTATLRKKKTEAPITVVEPTPGEVNRPGEHTVLKVTQDLDLKWHVELDGNRLEKPEESSAEQRQRAVNVVIQMRPWLEGKAAPAAPAAAAAPKPAAPAASIQQPKPEPSKLPAPVQTPAKRDDPRLSPVRGLNSMITKDVKAALKTKPTSIVEMIDAVLQTKLPNTPYKDQDIRMEDGPLGEINVVVDAQSYNGIDNVPDPEIRSLIREAIAEWEKK